jgi:hypothetical protein
MVKAQGVKVTKVSLNQSLSFVQGRKARLVGCVGREKEVVRVTRMIASERERELGSKFLSNLSFPD